MSKWQKVYTSELLHQAEIVKSRLDESKLNVVLLNKKDSSYNNFGAYEVYVKPDDVMKALKIIEDVFQS